MKKNLLYLYLGGLMLAPVVLLVLPADFFDTGQSVCLSVVLFDTTCYGCGITRAVQHLIHFDFTIAWQYNKLVVLVVPLLLFVWGEEIFRVWKKLKSAPKAGSN